MCFNEVIAICRGHTDSGFDCLIIKAEGQGRAVVAYKKKKKWKIWNIFSSKDEDWSLSL